ESVEALPLLSVILGGLIIVLILIIIALVVKIRKLHTDLKEEEHTPPRREVAVRKHNGVSKVTLTELMNLYVYPHGGLRGAVVQVSQERRVEEAVEPLPLLSVILGVLIFFLTVVIITLGCLQEEQCQSQLSQDLASDDLNDAALCSATVRSRRPASERVVTTHVLYTTSR
ncbi:hypothetical protein INR49_027969, partial [Caranx melampygus]